MIRILHIYHDLMSLYGDWANAAVLVMELNSCGVDAVIDKKSVGDELDFESYDFVYIGSGTERSLVACISDIMRHKASLIGRIEEGMHVLATGNSHEIFGMAVTDAKGGRHEALGLLNFETIQGGGRITGDCVCNTAFLQEKLIGFINRASKGQVGDIQRPFVHELGSGANDETNTEGIQYENVLGTYMTGPVLVRNPPLLKYFAGKLIGARAEEIAERSIPFFTFQEDAYRKALGELAMRMAAAN
ncbi:MAG: glutamine amidotransferase [Oscillospiraceae bacterium]|nr:glutamine amidotransferase [Oscillospiraceae bacterium]